jgi:transposase-like protein
VDKKAIIFRETTHPAVTAFKEGTLRFWFVMKRNKIGARTFDKRLTNKKKQINRFLAVL